MTWNVLNVTKRAISTSSRYEWYEKKTSCRSYTWYRDDGQTRLTLDMRCTKKAIKATNIPIPRVEEIKANLAGSGCFSKLDFKSAYHQLELSEESRYITVFHAGDKLMRYKNWPWVQNLPLENLGIITFISGYSTSTYHSRSPYYCHQNRKA